jgi:hypothetical protein
MKSIAIAALTVALFIPATIHQADRAPIPHRIQLATMCFKTGETVSGTNKICYYNCLGSQTAITISSVELCPLSIDR